MHVAAILDNKTVSRGLWQSGRNQPRIGFRFWQSSDIRLRFWYGLYA
jgi:hypothetical protein